MSVTIFLRQSAHFNAFRDSLLNALNSNANRTAVMTSGFFQEGGKGGYFASKELSAKGNGFFTPNSVKKITIIGLHNAQWLIRFQNFIDALRKGRKHVLTYRRKNYHWHAKIFILLENDIPILAIIGSSNITRPAFSTTSPFNIEADVLLISEDCNIHINDMISNLDPTSMIFVDYSEGKNSGITVKSRIQKLYDELVTNVE